MIVVMMMMIQSSVCGIIIIIIICLQRYRLIEQRERERMSERE